ncbi:hypothetical protein Ahy_B08g092362 [Arachis hypogaea]|uniref:Oxo-4-hydroxy-4-carboxy-5-ureidoimidazoline decarboxylase domain-containing protein n=1 Tax=Arachis hypogaea TaxID=3818 RepID=A0A444Y3S0_ARAHY|nr:hypothetical protein Ahy_B08g092362 [Arachis hypogaea]
MVEASPFSSLEHATSFARDLWFNTLPIQSWLDTFSAHRHIGDAITIAHGDIRTGLLQFATKYRKKFGFGFVTSTNLFLSQQILEEVQAYYENSLNVELEIASREEFTLIERGLIELWKLSLIPFSHCPIPGSSSLTLNPVIPMWERVGSVFQTTNLGIIPVYQLGKMPRVGHFTKKARVDTSCQQPQVGFHAASTSQRAHCPIPLSSGSGAPRILVFTPLSSAPQRTTPDAEDLDPEVDEVDSFDQYVDNLFAASDAQKHKGHKTTEFWDVKTTESDGTIKPVKLSVKEAMKPTNGRKIVLRFNSALQPVGDEAGLLSGVMELLGSDYTKFPICEKDWRKIRTKDKVYNECVKEMFHFKEDSRGIIKRIIFKMLGRAWKETRNRLYHHCYDSKLSLDENIENCPNRITADHWRWFLDYHNSEETQIEKLGKAQRRRVEKLKRKAMEDEVAVEKNKRQAVEDEVAAGKTKRQTMEDEVAARKVRMQAIESALICLLQGQGGKLPSDIAAWMSALEGQNKK